MSKQLRTFAFSIVFLSISTTAAAFSTNTTSSFFEFATSIYEPHYETASSKPWRNISNIQKKSKTHRFEYFTLPYLGYVNRASTINNKRKSVSIFDISSNPQENPLIIIQAISDSFKNGGLNSFALPPTDNRSPILTDNILVASDLYTSYLSVPEPTTIILYGLGLTGLIFSRKKNIPK